MTDTLESRAIEAAALAIDNVHDMDVTLDDYARASALAVLAEVRAKGTDTDLIAQADAALDGVTEGPWSQAHRRKSTGMFSTEIYRDDDADNTIASICWHAVPYLGGVTTDRPENAAFLAASRQLVPALRDALAAANAREAAMKAERDRLAAALTGEPQP